MEINNKYNYEYENEIISSKDMTPKQKQLAEIAKREKVDFCIEEFNKKVRNVSADLAGVDESRSRYKQLYPFEYKKHVEINKHILHHDLDELIEHLKYMKEKIRHDETFLASR